VTGLLYDISTPILMVLLLKAALTLVDPATIRSRRIPWAAAVLSALALAGVVVQLVWPAAMTTLNDDPAKAGWWRVVTSVFMQQGIAGTVFNIVTLAVVAALAEWFWGPTLTLALFAGGAVLPHHLGSLLGATTSGTDPRNFYGSSGATYFLAAALAATLLDRGRRERLRALSIPIIGLAVWMTVSNAHGLVAAEGFVIGAIVWAAARRLIHPRVDAQVDGGHVHDRLEVAGRRRSALVHAGPIVDAP
jgi:membrane associated rhomboid family serine protease